jgi:predicted dehydrogenase
MSDSICVIGAGQLGSRHLQALAALREDVRIFAVDPSGAALQTARERFAAVASPEQLARTVFAEDSSALPDELRLAIVASASGPRRSIVEGLLARSRVRYLILEKWLFASADDLDAVGALLRRTGTKAWVNCCRRMMPVYEDVKARIGAGPYAYHVSGTRFGLMGNLIHFADFLAWLCGSTDFTADLSELLRELHESKRPGYLELFGTVELRFADGSTGCISCRREGDLPLLVQLKGAEEQLFLDETDGVAFWRGASASEGFVQERFRIPYQSELTTVLAEELLRTGNCKLAPYEESAAIHRRLMEAVTRFLREELGYDKREFPFT